MNEKLVKKFKDGHLSVSCKTAEEAEIFVSWCFKNEIKWMESDDVSTRFNRYQDEIFYEYHYGYLHSLKRNTVCIDVVTFNEFFDIKPNVFSKNDLKSGMQIETRNGERYLVMLDYESLNYGKGVFVKVYAAKSDSRVLDLSSGKLIWERKEPKEMTINEVSKLLGYDIKIVGD